MHDEANSTAKWLSLLTEDGVGSRVWDSTIDLEIDQFEANLTGDYDSQLVITPLPAKRDHKPFDEDALMAELMQPVVSVGEQKLTSTPEPAPGEGSVSREAIEAENTSAESNFSQAALTSQVSAPHVVPRSCYTWQPSRQPPPFEPASAETQTPTKREKPVIILADNYQVVSGLGKGVMCTVFKVKDLTSGKLMVLKLLPKDLWVKANCLDQFKSEVGEIAALQHPNLIPFRTHGFTSEGQPFLVMDYLHGITLSRAIAADNGLPLTRVVQIFDQLCRGLSLVHEKGLSHRDIRPENVMFLSKSGDYNVKLVDFGIAKLVSQGFDPMKQLAATGEVFGNPPFMSPEECRGEQIDQRSDIYSLGCVMYMAMTGKPPFFGSASTETLKKQQNDPLPQPSKIRPAMCKASQAGWVTVSDLEYIVMRCLEKDRTNRYQTVQEILHDLDKLRQLIPLQQTQHKKSVSVLRTAEMKCIPKETPKPANNKFALVACVIVIIVLAASVAAYTLFSPKPLVPTSNSTASDKAQETLIPAPKSGDTSASALPPDTPPDMVSKPGKNK